MKPIGFLLNTKDGLSGDAGLYYDYILAANGLFRKRLNSLMGRYRGIFTT
jgi:hypothetical protein